MTRLLELEHNIYGPEMRSEKKIVYTNICATNTKAKGVENYILINW